MPPILHPRSRSTSTLFTTTLAVSFLVVGIPHFLPCPVNPRQFADSIEGPEGQPGKRRRRKKCVEDTRERADATGPMEEGGKMSSRADRECPVPKPGGLVGRIMGFTQREREKPLEVVIKEMKHARHGEKKVEDFASKQSQDSP
ncbi:hypothetical protein B0A48_02893 [Cryoendolithus antarcticus]|uniref:Uncharacterized protein n=1 Tax=Cryoendolithus antarcticus TaxID=1507870 RepID=A0A1V8TM12_9PEZI|nr:hypothetical protein B0A48_02893 [Cryoendolithus antarcticus]